jgi:hypothetical protein
LLASQAILLVCRYLIVCHRYALAPTAVLSVDTHHGMGGCTGASEEVQDNSVRVALNEKS